MVSTIQSGLVQSRPNLLTLAAVDGLFERGVIDTELAMAARSLFCGGNALSCSVLGAFAILKIF